MTSADADAELFGLEDAEQLQHFTAAKLLYPHLPDVLIANVVKAHHAGTLPPTSGSNEQGRLTQGPGKEVFGMEILRQGTPEYDSFLSRVQAHHDEQQAANMGAAVDGPAIPRLSDASGAGLGDTHADAVEEDAGGVQPVPE